MSATSFSETLIEKWDDFATQNPDWYIALLQDLGAGFPTFTDTDGWAAYTALEATFKGYAKAHINPVPAATWDATNHRAIVSLAQQTFAYNSGAGGDASNTITSWVLLASPDAGSTFVIMYADNFDVGLTISADGQTIPLTLTPGDGQCP
jgi:hypothetical protein